MVNFMKKNNKYRSSNNNYNNQIYSLNYKFDSISVAGKVSGTALDLIKRYNELAKEAQGNADYVAAENFRQYAEHYRKIVTEINERKNQRIQYHNNEDNPSSGAEMPQAANVEEVSQPTVAETQSLPDNTVTEETKKSPKRAFKIIEINASDSEQTTVSRPRTRAPRKPKVEVVVAQ